MIENFVAIDIETSGLNPAEDKIIEIGMVKVIEGKIADKYETLVNPRLLIGERITQLTGITQDMLEQKPFIEDIIGDIIAFTEDLPVLGHNVIFDYSFIKKAAVNSGLKFEKTGIDTLKLARRLLPELEHKNLEYLCEHFGIEAGSSHRAYDDAVSAMKLFYVPHDIKPDDSGFCELMTLNYSVKKDSPITPAQRSYLSALVTKHNVTLPCEIDSLSKSRASKLIDGIISEYGR